jgi:3'-phosphoadenosine 5'-phosphosulfate sulfotransferase (PAPS reductase)/FAD synthetase
MEPLLSLLDFRARRSEMGALMRPGEELSATKILNELATDACRDLDLTRRVAAIRGIVCGRVVFTTSFGIEDQAIMHVIFRQALAIDVMTLDTGRLFPESYELWARTERRYGRRIQALYPQRD